VDSTRLNSSSALLINNGLLDHDGQFIAINNTVATANLIPVRQRTRKIYNESHAILAPIKKYGMEICL
jgi:hypothetical protein